MGKVSILLLLMVAAGSLCAGDTVYVDASFNEINLGDRITYMKAGAGTFTAREVLSSQHRLQKHNKKLFFSDWHETDSCYWLVFDLKNTGSWQTVFLELDNALIGEIDYYLYEDLPMDSAGKPARRTVDHNIAGDNYPFSNRQVNNRCFVYRLPLNASSTYTVLIRLYNDGRNFHVPLILRSGKNLYDKDYSKQLIYGMYFGIMFIIFLFNLTLYFLVREKVYSWYAAFTFSFAMMQMGFSGYSFQYLWPDLPYIADKSLPFFTALSSILALQFTRSFYDNAIGPRLAVKLIRAYQLILLLCMTGSFIKGWPSYAAIYSLYYLFAGTYIIIFIISLRKAFQSGLHYSRFYLGGTIVFIITAAFINLYSDGDITDENIFTNNPVLIGMLLIFASISVSIFDRLLLLKKQKEKAQQESIDSLEQLNLLKQYTNELLEKKVAEKTNELIRKQQEVNNALIDGEEKERKRLSQELHDGLGSMLSTIKLNLVSVNDDKVNKANAAYELNTVISMIDKACDEVRAISHNMTPPMFEKFGLVRSLEDVMSRLNEASHLDCRFEVYDYTSFFNYTKELSIYRMIMELINNVLRHAGAGKLNVQLFTHDDELVIMVEDDGKGIVKNNENVGIGFRNINSRLEGLDGKIDIDSREGQGTTVIIRIPVLKEMEHGKKH